MQLYVTFCPLVVELDAYMSLISLTSSVFITNAGLCVDTSLTLLCFQWVLSAERSRPT